MKVTVSLRDFINEMDVLSDEHTAYLNKRTGELITLSDEELSAAEDEVDLSDYPEWQQEMIEKALEKMAIEWLEDNHIAYSRDTG